MLPLFESIINFTDLRAFLSIAIKHRRLMVLCFCAGMSGGVAFMVHKKPVYYSKSLININQEAPLPVDTAVIFRDTTHHSIISQLNSPHIMERTARALGIAKTYNDIRANHIKQQRIQVNSEYDLELTIWPYSSDLARQWPETLVNAYLEYRDEKRFERRERIVKSYTEEMLKIREKMAEFEKNTQKFIDDSRMDDTKRQLSDLAHVPTRMAAVNVKFSFLNPIRNEIARDDLSVTEKLSLLSSTRRRIEQLEIGQIIPLAAMAGTTNIEPARLSEQIVTPDLITIGEPWQRMERDQRRLLNQLADAEKVFLPGHRTVVELKHELDKVATDLTVELDLALARFNLEYTALESERRTLEKQMDELRAIIRHDAALTKDFSLLQSSRLSWEQMFSKLATTLEQIDFGADKERVQIQYMGLVEQRDGPLSPNKRKVFMFALLVGLGLAVGIPFLLEYLDDTIVVDEQVERMLKVRTIAVIPEIDRGQSSATQLSLTQNQEDRRLHEYFRVLRVNLLSNVHFEGNRQVFMVTSALPKEGKSVIALNLAVAFARLGEKTLLIDADLRRGTLHRVLNASSRPGLGQLLDSDFDETTSIPIQQVEANLDFIACGRHAHASSERLESAVFGALMRKMRQDYARIIIDTPPILGLAETVSMVKHSDGVILVVWSGNTALKAVKTAKGMLDANGARYFGCALNKLDLTNAATYYYYYYYSYKYYQAYHQVDENTPQPPDATPG